MGRKKTSGAFSLFSFQDIITSVTAILILVMLLLTIELITKRRAKSASDPVATRQHLDAVLEELESTVTRMRREAIAASHAQRTLRIRAELEEDLHAATDSLDAVRIRLDETSRTLQAAERLGEEAQTRQEQARVDTEVAVALLAKISEDTAEANRLETANGREQERQGERRQEILGRPVTGTELIFNRPANASRRPWLVELSSQGVAVVLLGSNSRQELGAIVATGGGVADWIGTLKQADDYCLLLIRPSAGTDLLAPIEDALTAQMISFGVDFIGEDQAVRDGAAAGFVE